MTVTVFHERADQQRYLWIDAPLSVTVANAIYQAVRWSIAGVALRSPELRAQPVGQQVALRISLPFQGYEIAFPTTGLIETADADAVAAGGVDTVVIRFDALTNRDRELLGHFLGELVQGRMAPVEDTLRRIDVPVVPTRLTADAMPTPSMRVRRPLRAVAMSAAYLAAGAAVFGYLGTVAYSNLVWQDIPVAAISADLEPAHAMGGGTIALAAVKVGDRIKAGDLIARIIDTRLEREIRLGDISVREREMRWRIAEGERRKYRRIDIPSMSRADIQLAVDRQKELLAQRADRDVTAPFDGIVAALPLANNASVRLGDVVALLERGNRREVTAFVTAGELERIQVGGRALVHVPGDRGTFPARIAEIVPNGAVLERLSGRTSAGRVGSLRPAERQADVKLILTGDTADFTSRMLPGQPVMVMLERRTAQRVAAAVTQTLADVRAKFASLGDLGRRRSLGDASPETSTIAATHQADR
jgi:multidrug efflux pump subunit AcrA (membrane-fusion protein)